MNFRPACLFLIVMVFAYPACAQTVEVLRQSSFRPDDRPTTFDYIEPVSDSVGFQFVASLRVIGDKGMGPDVLYQKLKAKAIKLRANSFRFIHYQQGDSTHQSELTVDCYAAPDAVLTLNATMHEKNVIYIFGSVDSSSGKRLSFMVDKVQKEIAAGAYFRQPIPQGQAIKIGKGGFAGPRLTAKWQAGRTATFLTFTGAGLADAPVEPGKVNVGFSFGGINYVEDGLGYLLIMFLRKTE